MNQIDLVLLIVILLGGWLGAVKGSVRAFVSLSGTVLGLAVAGLYGAKLVPLAEWVFASAATRIHLEFPWVTAVSTQAAWRQSVNNWLGDLLWPIGLKQLIAAGFDKLPSGETVAGFAKVVEDGFVVALANICAFVTLLLLTKGVVALVAGFSLRLALHARPAVSAVGFVAGLVQSGILVIVLLALLVPFFLWVGHAPISQSLQPSFAWQAVQWLWSSILMT